MNRKTKKEIKKIIKQSKLMSMRLYPTKNPKEILIKVLPTILFAQNPEMFEYAMECVNKLEDKEKTVLV